MFRDTESSPMGVFEDDKMKFNATMKTENDVKVEVDLMTPTVPEENNPRKSEEQENLDLSNKRTVKEMDRMPDKMYLDYHLIKDEPGPPIIKLEPQMKDFSHKDTIWRPINFDQEG